MVKSINGKFEIYELLEVFASGSSNLCIGANGNVGIGTNTPSYLLDVQGSFNFQSSPTFYARSNYMIDIQAGTNNYLQLNRDNFGITELCGSASVNIKNSTGQGISIDTLSTTFINGYKVIFRDVSGFAYGYWDTNNYRLKIGRLGISYTPPTHTLHIYGNSGNGEFRLEDTFQGTGKILTSDANGVGKWTSINALSTKDLGVFYDTSTQTTSVNTITPVIFGSTDISNGVTIQSNTKITVSTTGKYTLQFSAQAYKVSGATSETINIWLRKNGTNINGSNIKNVITNAGQPLNILLNWFFDLNANDYIEVMWTITDTNIQLQFDGVNVLIGTPATLPAKVIMVQI